MYVVGIVGSKREMGNSEQMIRTCLEEVEKSGIKTDLILLRNIEIEMCDGCLKCDETGSCHIDDGMNEINNKLTKAVRWPE